MKNTVKLCLVAMLMFLSAYAEETSITSDADLKSLAMKDNMLEGLFSTYDTVNIILKNGA